MVFLLLLPHVNHRNNMPKLSFPDSQRESTIY